MKNKIFWSFFVVFLLISIFSRATQVFNAYNYYFDSEKATEYQVTKSIVVNHKIVLVAHQGGSDGFYKPPGFNYLLAVPFIGFKGDPFGGRLLMLLISVLTVVTAFVLANRMLGLRAASFISLLLAFSPILKDYAGSISPPFIIPFCIVLFIYAVFNILKGEKKLIPILIFLVGVMTNFEIATSANLLTLLMLTWIVLIPKKVIPLKYIFISLILFAVNLMPLVIYDLQNNFANIKGVIKTIELIGKHSVGGLMFNFVNILSARLSVFEWNFSATFSTNTFVWLFLLILIILGTLKITKEKETKNNIKLFTGFLGIIPLFTFIFLLFYPSVIIPQWWIADLSVIYCFLLGIILNYMWIKLNLKLVVVGVLLVLSILFIKRTIFIYQTQFSYPPSTYIPEETVLNYVFKDAGGKPFGIIVDSKKPQQNYDYLIWWIGNTKYHYQPYREKKGLYYVVQEPKSVVNEIINSWPGKLISIKTLNNGFIIEKRLVN